MLMVLAAGWAASAPELGSWGYILLDMLLLLWGHSCIFPLLKPAYQAALVPRRVEPR